MKRSFLYRYAILGAGILALYLGLLKTAQWSIWIPMAFYVFLPISQIVLHYVFKKNVFDPVWNETLISKIKYVLFIVQAALLIWLLPLIPPQYHTAIGFFFTILNIALVGVHQAKESKNLIYLLPVIYFMLTLKMQFVPNAATFFDVQGITTSFIIDYLLWFLMYPKIEVRLPILLHALLPVVTFYRPEQWIVARSLMGSIVLMLSYNRFTYPYFFDTTSFKTKIENFQQIYTPLFFTYLFVKMISMVLFG